MSAKGRKSETDLMGRYYTPLWLCEAITPYLPTDPMHILEPAVGTGNILNTVKQYYEGTKILRTRTKHFTSVDIDPESIADFKVDFLTWETDQKFDLQITNPNFPLAFDYIQKMFTLAKDKSSVIFLLTRLNWLASKKRATWLRQHTPSVYVTPKRPSFNGVGTDATEYAFLEWQPLNPDFTPTIHILETEDL